MKTWQKPQWTKILEFSNWICRRSFPEIGEIGGKVLRVAIQLIGKGFMNKLF